MKRTISSRPPARLRATRIGRAWDEVVVLSYPVSASPRRIAASALTPAERDVLALLLAGHTNREIAERRGTGARTVGKQIDAIYRKLGVHSRAELAARFG